MLLVPATADDGKGEGGGNVDGTDYMACCLFGLNASAPDFCYGEGLGYGFGRGTLENGGQG